MRFADEVIDRSEVEELSGRRSKPDAQERKLAAQIIDALSTRWDPRRYHDTYTEQLNTLIEHKARGKELAVEKAGPSEARVVNLLEALEASLSGAKSSARPRGGGRKKKDSASRNAPAAKGSATQKRLAPRDRPIRRRAWRPKERLSRASRRVRGVDLGSRG